MSNVFKPVRLFEIFPEDVLDIMYALECRRNVSSLMVEDSEQMTL